MRTRKVADVGRDLPCKDRISIEPPDLCSLNLIVPVSALSKPYLNPSADLSRKTGQKVEDRDGSFRVRLNNQSESFPATKFWTAEDLLNDLKRKLEPISFLGIDREANIGTRRMPREEVQTICQFREDPSPLGNLIARMQSR